MNDPALRPSADAALDLVCQLEARLARIEHHLHLAPMPAPWPGVPAAARGAPVEAAAPVVAALEGQPEAPPTATAEISPANPEDLEFEVGQRWFARIGIIAVALGVAFLLSLPFADLPAMVPPLGGGAIAGVLLLLAHLGRNSFELAANYARGAGMLVAFVATLRLFFHGGVPVLDSSSFVGRALLAIVVAGNLWLAVRRQSRALVGLGLLCGCVAVLFVGTAGFLLGGVTILAGVTVVVARRLESPGLALAGQVFVYATYVLWAMGNPMLGHDIAAVTSPLAAPFFVLGWAVIFAGAGLFWPASNSGQDAVCEVSALFNAGAAFLVFVGHVLTGFGSFYLASMLIAGVVLLGIAVGCWLRHGGRIATFAYAIIAYNAVSLAIIHVSSVPDVFVWLALESLGVVATAIWFRSRFIVVANFLIGVVIVLAYVGMAKQETGISLVFGVVTLLTARILNWQRDRLELRTDAMRNAYLIGAFALFPYAFYHLVPSVWVVPAWVGVALFYYGLNLAIRNPKYRWMGHGTLLLSVAYAAVIGVSQLSGAARVLSLLVLGTMLLVVSLVFTRLRARRQQAA